VRIHRWWRHLQAVRAVRRVLVARLNKNWQIGALLKMHFAAKDVEVKRSKRKKWLTQVFHNGRRYVGYTPYDVCVLGTWLSTAEG
jgi:hypothetical protein